MKIDTSFLKPVTKVIGKGITKCKKHSPEILIVAGVISFGGTIVAACKGTTKIDAVIDDTKSAMDRIHTGVETGLTPAGVAYTQKDAQKDTFITYGKAGVAFLKIYSPTIVLSVMTLASFLGAYGIMKKRNLALTAAYAVLERSYKQYQQRVANKYGTEEAENLRLGLTSKKIDSVEVDPETGKEKKVKKTVICSDPNITNEYAFYFDRTTSREARNDTVGNMFFLRGQQAHLNDLLALDPCEYMFMSKLLEELDINLPDTEADSRLKKAAQIVGWTREGSGDEHIDLRMREVVREMPDGTLMESILIDPNVEGNIWEKL